jgi:ribosomal protein S18 acetylase RimI-like enzyme
MGMVHPDCRGQGVFRALHNLAVSEWRRRGVKAALLLSDGRSASGQAFVKATGAAYHHAEYEMYLRNEAAFAAWPEGSIAFRKALNADAGEVARQNAIYFGEELGEQDGERETLLPEVEEQRGVTTYLAEAGGAVVGKTHLQLINGLGGIFGLGVLPEWRGKGLGREILLESVRRLRAAGAREVMLQVATENKNALRLYESCGFETTSTMEYFELALTDVSC